MRQPIDTSFPLARFRANGLNKPDLSGWRAVLVTCLLLWLSGCSYLQPFPNTEEHIVAKNESLYAIAWRYEVDFRDLAEWNGIGKPYRIYPGQRLVLHPFGGGPKRRPIVQPDSEPERSRPSAKLKTTAVIVAPTQTEKVVAPSPKPGIRPVESAGTIIEPTEKPVNRPVPAEPVVAPPKPTAKTAEANVEPPVKVAKAKPLQIERPVRTRNGWAWPTAGKPSESYKDTGTGISIPGQLGQTVHSAANGKVVYAGGGLKGYGLLVIIKHSDEYLTAYGYNDRLLVAQGEEVKAGQKIATMGLGPENKTMLHFELRRNGRPVDPMRLLPAPE